MLVNILTFSILTNIYLFYFSSNNYTQRVKISIFYCLITFTDLLDSPVLNFKT